MQRHSRDTVLNIGKGVYNVRVQIGTEELDRVKALIDEAYGELSAGASQEDMLVLACLRLGYELDAVNQKLKAVLGSIT
ncbi:MAG: hypothetical protein IJS39_14015 [Synergistaceae bacterium]|nr:hypothetical protein [Synergistaceae bacterium]